MRRIAILTLCLALAGSIAYGADIDLTAADLYVRKGFDPAWINQPISGEMPGWLRVPGRQGNRPVRVRELGLPGVPVYRHFSLKHYPSMQFTYLTNFMLTREALDSGVISLYLAQIGLNWQIYLNGNLIRDEAHLSPDGKILQERAVRGLLLQLDRRFLREGANVLAFRIIGIPTDDRTGLYMKDKYLVGDYQSLHERFRNEYVDFMLIAVYFFFGILYLLIYALRRTEHYILFYGLATVGFAITILFRTKQVFDIFNDTRIMLYVQFLSMFLSLPAFTAFSDTLLRQRITVFSRFYAVLCLALCIAIPLPLRETALRIWQALTLLSLLYMIVYNILMLLPAEFRGYFRNTLGAGVIRIIKSAFSTLLRGIPGNLLIGFCALIVCIAVDIRNGNAGIPTAYSQYGFFFVIMGIAGILAKQYVMVYNRLDRYSASLQKEVAERKRSEEDLLYTRNYLRNVFNSLPSMMVSIDPEGLVNQCNAAGERLTGLAISQMTGLPLIQIPPFRAEDGQVFKETMKTGIPYELHRKHMFCGENKSLRIAFFPMLIDNTQGAVIRVDDITDMERKEDQLRQAQKMETVGTLAGGLAHDFNNVLGGIVGTISIVKFKLHKGIDISVQSMKDYIDTIEQSGKRAADMVQQLLSLSRKQELSFAPVDLNLTIKHVFKICSNTIDKAVELKPCYTTEPAMVNADPGQLEQVLLNLAVNAGHAMTIMMPPDKHQGGTLTIALRKILADRFFCSNHPEAQEIGYWVLSVQDTGTGMDSKTVAKIFDPFFTTKEKGKGTGLGLAMVYNIVQQHKGFIDVYSEVGHGTTFSVYLPRLEGVHGVSAGVEDMKIARGEGVILVVDDESIMREVAERILAECGYKAIFAENGQEGVEVFRKERDKIVMVLLDMVMPKKSGKEAFIEMKKIDPNVKVLLASGFRKDERVEEILSLGVKGFIQKPFTIGKLSEAIRATVHE